MSPKELESRNLRILIVDDAIENHNVIKAFFTDYPYTFFSAYDGREGLEIFQKESFDLVFMDMYMPDIGGVEAIKLLRAHEEVQGLESTPIAALTSSTDGDKISDMIESGCNHFVQKPFQKKELFSVMSELLPQEEIEK